MTKILYSPGFGAGWSTWCSGDKKMKKFVLTYKPLIDALEEERDIGYTVGRLLGHESPYEPGSILEQFDIDLKAAFGDEAGHMYLGGARDLAVAEVDGPFRVDEYDGNESVIHLDVERDYFDFSEDE